MDLTSNELRGGAFEARHGKKFDNASPDLAWTGVPADAASLVLTLVDLHPVARGYLHWFVADLPPGNGGLPATPDGALAMGRAIKPYAGPFPPSGTHDYQFTLTALDGAAPALSTGTSVAEFERLSEGHVLATATLTASFTKPKPA